MKRQQCCKDDIEEKIVPQLGKQVTKQVAVPKIHRKEGESPFIGCTSGNIGGKAIKKDNHVSLSTP